MFKGNSRLFSVVVTTFRPPYSIRCPTSATAKPTFPRQKLHGPKSQRTRLLSTTQRRKIKKRIHFGHQNSLQTFQYTHFNSCHPPEGGNRGVNLPSPYFLSQFLPPPYFFQPISPSPLNVYLTFSPSSLYFFPLFLPPPNFFWAISPSSLFCSSPLNGFIKGEAMRLVIELTPQKQHLRRASLFKNFAVSLFKN